MHMDMAQEPFHAEIVRTKGFAADKGSLEFDSRVLGDLVLPLIM